EGLAGHGDLHGAGDRVEAVGPQAGERELGLRDELAPDDGGDGPVLEALQVQGAAAVQRGRFHGESTEGDVDAGASRTGIVSLSPGTVKLISHLPAARMGRTGFTYNPSNAHPLPTR